MPNQEGGERMSNPISSTDDPKASARPKVLKLYTYGKLEFVLHQGCQPARQFDIHWMRAESSTRSSDREPANEDAGEGYRRG